MSARKILVIDDDLATRSLLQTVLEHNGNQCTLAGDGRAAGDLLLSDRYDVILMDLLLPERDGFDLLREMKRSPSLHPMVSRTIVMTAAIERIYSGREDLDPVWCVLRKPFDIGELMEQVESCAEQRPRPERKSPGRVDPPARLNDKRLG